MNRQDIIDMAVKAGFTVGYDSAGDYVAPQYRDSIGTLLRFAEMVAKQEREACAKVCYQYAMAFDHAGVPYVRNADCRQAGKAILARGKER